MKKLNSLKLMGMLVLVVSFAVGCAGTTEEACLLYTSPSPRD